MKILYNQSHTDSISSVFLDNYGIQQCYFKYLCTDHDAGIISLKSHYHTHYEIHIVEQGSITYETAENIYPLNSGHFILLPPLKLHRMLNRSADASSFSITFHLNGEAAELEKIHTVHNGSIPERIVQNIKMILTEHNQPELFSDRLVAGNILEILILLWRNCGFSSPAAPWHENTENPRLTMVKQYISDNIERAPSVSEVAAYCHLSTRQLARLFDQWESCSPATYINRLRTQQIESLLKNRELSLHQISEYMNFSSEYYFNSYFKKHAGMTPGTFRSMYT